MKLNKFLSAALVATMGFGSAAYAIDGSSDNPSGNEYQARDQQQRDNARQGGYAPQAAQRQFEQRTQHEQRTQPGDYSQRNHDRNGYAQRQYDRNAYAQRQYEQRNWDHRGYAYSAPQYQAYGNYTNGPRYWAGGYVPQQYRAQRYWVNDWRSRHYAPPPYGYQYVQTDTGDVLLMALATGLIASVVLSQSQY